MSKITATVKDIENLDSLNIVTFSHGDIVLKMMSLDLDENIKTGSKVLVAVKPSHVSIAKDFSGMISHSNQFKAKIVDINNGKLLSVVMLQVEDILLESIITLNSVQNMDLKIGDEVTVFIKASELSIAEVL